MSQSFLNAKFDSLTAYTPGEQPQNKTLIKLNTNELPYPASSKAIAAAAQAARTMQLYPDPNGNEVCNALSSFMNLQPNQVTFSNGSDEMLGFAFMGFCPNGAAFADITYGFYNVFADLYQVEKQIMPLKEDFSIDINAYNQLGKTIFIANPNAPTGLLLSVQDIETILQNNLNSLVIIDEAYIDFGGKSCVTLIPKYNNLLVIGTFSKSRGMAGARFGWAAGNEQLIADINKIRYSFNPYNVNKLTLAAATAAIKDVGYFGHCVNRIIKTREITQECLKHLGFICNKSYGNFVFVKHPKFSGQEVYAYLRQQGILVRWFNQPKISDYVRISIGTEKDMETLINTLENLIPNVENV